MCVVSNMGDIVQPYWTTPPPLMFPPGTIPSISPGVVPPIFTQAPLPGPVKLPFPTREQFEAFDTLLRAAQKFDAATGQKECETAAKTAWIKSFYDHFGMQCPL